MAYVAVLDACVLYPASLRDVLLRLAAKEFYDLRWSERILDEAERNLVKDGRMSEDQAVKLRAAMSGAFDGASVELEAVERLEDSMLNDAKDRHVLAAAVACEAQAVVTMNLKDFPEEASEPFSVEVMHPDEFLMVLFSLNAGLVADVVIQQAAALKNPPLTVDDVLSALAQTVPQFAEAVREELMERDRHDGETLRGARASKRPSAQDVAN
jgi:predicted nucleic acid-binding protein